MSQGQGPNWLGLLKWSLAQSDGTTPSNFHAMNEEDRKWLEEVMTNGVRDDPKRMSEIIQEIDVCLQSGQIHEEKIEMSFEELIDITGQIDMAQIFVKFGGTKYLLDLIDWNEFPLHLRGMAASLINTIAQNNAKVQIQFFETNIVDRLVRSFHLHRGTPALCSKILCAISGAVRGHRESEISFFLSHSLQILSSIFPPSPSPSLPVTNDLLRRTLFFFDALLSSPYLTPLLLPFNHHLHSQMLLSLPSSVPLSSDDISSHLSSLLSLLLPSLFPCLLSSDIEVRENAFLLLLTLSRPHPLILDPSTLSSFSTSSSSSSSSSSTSSESHPCLGGGGGGEEGKVEGEGEGESEAHPGITQTIQLSHPPSIPTPPTPPSSSDEQGQGQGQGVCVSWGGRERLLSGSYKLGGGDGGDEGEESVWMCWEKLKKDWTEKELRFREGRGGVEGVEEDKWEEECWEREKEMMMEVETILSSFSNSK